MVVPTDYAIQIIIDGNDVSQNVPYESLDFEDNRRDPSFFSMTVENPSVAPAQGDFVQVIALSLPNTPTIFTGWVRTVETRKRALGTVLDYAIECGDFKERLQKSVIDYGDFAGSDANVIEDLFANVYPNLDNWFDYTSGIDSFASDLNFNVNNESLLDALNRLSDLTGANMRNERGQSSGDTITFDGGDGWNDNTLGSTTTPYYAYELFAGTGTAAVTGGELVFSGLSSNPGTAFQARIHFTIASAQAPTNITFDFKVVSATLDPFPANKFQISSGGNVTTEDIPSAYLDGAWHTIDWNAEFGSATWNSLTVQSLRANLGTVGVAESIAVYFDNILLEYGTPVAESSPKDQVKWSQTPELTDFDLDIPNSDEYAFDIVDFQGAIDSVNSVTVVGGKKLVAVDWIYDADGASTRINLEAPIKSLAVFKNTGNDVSPSWTSQALGTFGTDELTGDGGTKDVVYDPNHHWLLFNTAPLNLTKAVRVTGSVEKPIRVRVENIGTGEETYATVVTNEQITSEEEALAYGNAILAKKNSLNRITFTTPNPGLKVGQALPILDSTRGIDTTLIIQRIRTRWIGSSGHALFDVECGADETEGLDSIVAGIDKKANKNAGGGAFATTTVDQLTDTDGAALYDTSGALLYE